MRSAVLAASLLAMAAAADAADLVAFNEVSFKDDAGEMTVHVDGTTTLPDGAVLTLLIRYGDRTVPGVGAYVRVKKGRARGQAGPIPRALAPGVYQVDLRFLADDQDPALLYDIAGIPDQSSLYEVRVGSIDDVAKLEKEYRGKLEAAIAAIEKCVGKVHEIVDDVRAKRRFQGGGGLDVAGLVSWVREWDKEVIDALALMRAEAERFALPYKPEFTEPLARAHESMHYLATYWVGQLCQENKAKPPEDLGLGSLLVPPEMYEKDYLASLQPMKDWLHPPEDKEE